MTLDLGTDGLETDVVLSVDDEVFALHDPILSISTDGDGWAHETSARRLRQLHIRNWSGEPSNEHPMSLPELLERIPADLPVQLDVKADADPLLACRTAAQACEVARAAGAADQVEIISFFSDACATAVQHGVAARLVVWADYSPADLARWAVARGFCGIAIEGFILHEEVARILHQAGLSISVGAVNTAGQLEKLLPMAPDIVVTDRPAALGRTFEPCSPRVGLKASVWFGQPARGGRPPDSIGQPHQR